jgi:Ni/Fe-hydrogenase 1 B-type cytochrome subunit
MATPARAATRVSDRAEYEHVYVWELPVRLTHWVNAVAIAVLSLTGFYIGWPFLEGGALLMSWMRAIHRLAGYVLVASLLFRTYWSFAGNEWASWRALFPWLTRAGWQGMFRTALFYVFLRRDPPRELGHNRLAGLAYSAVVTLLLVEVLTGFALDAFERGGGWVLAFGWVFWFGAAQEVRLVHHLVMWLLLGFTVHHVYSSALMDAEERNGLMTSIISGWKFPRRRPR